MPPKEPDNSILTSKASEEQKNDSNILNDVSVLTVQLFRFKPVEIEQPKPTSELFRLLQALDLIGGQYEPVLGWEHQLFREDTVLRTLQKAIKCYSGRPKACHRELCLKYDSLSDVVRQLLALFELTRENPRRKKLLRRDVLDAFLLALSGDSDRLKTMLQPSQCALQVFSQWQAVGTCGLSKSMHLYANAVVYVLSVSRGLQRVVSDHQEEFWSWIERL